MGWKEAQSRYQKGETLAAQDVEDLVARRVLRGLGLSGQAFPRMERAVFGIADFDEALWPRVLKMFKYALRQEGLSSYAEHRNFECLESKGGDHRDILERLVDVPLEAKLQAVFLTRLKDTGKSTTYSVWMYGDLYKLKPPYTVLTEIVANYGLVIQETEHFVWQFMSNGMFKDAAERAAYEER